MDYRIYQPEDFAALYAVEEVCFQPPFRFGRRYMRRLVDSRNGATWIAEEEGRMGGFSIVEWNDPAGGVNAYLSTIEVLPEFRGRGVGSELLRRAEDSARQTEAVRMWLHVDEANASAIRLYEARGYSYFDREEHFYAPGRGALIYKKALASEAGQ